MLGPEAGACFRKCLSDFLKDNFLKSGVCLQQTWGEGADISWVALPPPAQLRGLHHPHRMDRQSPPFTPSSLSLVCVPGVESLCLFLFCLFTRSHGREEQQSAVEARLSLVHALSPALFCYPVGILASWCLRSESAPLGPRPCPPPCTQPGSPGEPRGPQSRARLPTGPALPAD